MVQNQMTPSYAPQFPPQTGGAPPPGLDEFQAAQAAQQVVPPSAQPPVSAAPQPGGVGGGVPTVVTSDPAAVFKEQQQAASQVALAGGHPGAPITANGVEQQTVSTLPKCVFGTARKRNARWEIKTPSGDENLDSVI